MIVKTLVLVLVTITMIEAKLFVEDHGLKHYFEGVVEKQTIPGDRIGLEFEGSHQKRKNCEEEYWDNRQHTCASTNTTYRSQLFVVSGFEETPLINIHSDGGETGTISGTQIIQEFTRERELREMPDVIYHTTCYKGSIYIEPPLDQDTINMSCYNRFFTYWNVSGNEIGLPLICYKVGGFVTILLPTQGSYPSEHMCYADPERLFTTPNWDNYNYWIVDHWIISLISLVIVMFLLIVLLGWLQILVKFLIIFKILLYPFRRKAKGKSYRTAVSRVIPLVILLPQVFAQSCSDTSSIISTSTTCTTNGEDRICNSIFSLNTNLPYVGGTKCLSILDEEEGLLGNLNITFLQMQVVPSTRIDYYTASWTPHALSVKRCYRAGMCNGLTCNLVEANQDKTCGGEITDRTYIDYPSRVWCRRVCGCAGCDCFYCTDACLCNAVAFVPTGDSYKVSSFTSLKFVPVLRISMGNATGSKSSSILKASSGEITINNFRIRFTGSLQGDLTSVNNRKLVVNQRNNTAWFAEAAPVGSPTVNWVGDIQSEVSPVANDFLWPTTGMVGISEGTSVDTFKFVSPGLSRLTASPKLPLLYGGIYWAHNISLNGYQPSPAAQLIEVSTTSPVIFVNKISVVCPKLGNLMLAGCYQCVSGFQLNFSAYSTCGDGLARVYFKEMNMTLDDSAVQLTSGNQSYSMTGHTEIEQGRATFCLRGDSSHVACAGVDFRLAEEVILPDSNGTSIMNKSGGAGKDFFIHPFKKGWSTAVWVTIFVAVGIVTLVVIIRCLRRPKTKVA